MSLNHHVLAKTATDEVLSKFKSTEWKCAGSFGQDFYRVGTGADFPSPDAAFYDPVNKMMISFEFKPPTESKRGILTGIGQSIAYLQDSDVSYLIAPLMLEDYQIGKYLSDLYANQISKKIPAGLILYDNNDPTQMDLAQDIDSIETSGVKNNVPKIERFWAKHQDLPIPLFHLLLHYYYLGRTNIIKGDPFAECWLGQMISPTVLKSFDIKPIYDISGKVIKTVAGSKQMVFLEKIILRVNNLSNSKKRCVLSHAIDTTFVGDNYYNSVKKNFVSFLKNMQMLDSESCMTERGYKLYHIGLVNGPTSKIFTDYFIKELLTTGHHLDLLLDLDSIKMNHSGDNIETVIKEMESEYENKGYIKRNPKRMSKSVSKVQFLKYERILWKALDLIDTSNNIQWRKITEICSLPDV